MKYNNSNFLQLTRELFTSNYNELSINAKLIYN